MSKSCSSDFLINCKNQCGYGFMGQYDSFACLGCGNCLNCCPELCAEGKLTGCWTQKQAIKYLKKCEKDETERLKLKKFLREREVERLPKWVNQQCLEFFKNGNKEIIQDLRKKMKRSYFKGNGDNFIISEVMKFHGLIKVRKKYVVTTDWEKKQINVHDNFGKFYESVPVESKEKWSVGMEIVRSKYKGV